MACTGISFTYVEKCIVGAGGVHLARAAFDQGGWGGAAPQAIRQSQGDAPYCSSAALAPGITGSNDLLEEQRSSDVRCLCSCTHFSLLMLWLPTAGQHPKPSANNISWFASVLAVHVCRPWCTTVHQTWNCGSCCPCCQLHELRQGSGMVCKVRVAS
jgi:hypothetical protein